MRKLIALFALCFVYPAGAAEVKNPAVTKFVKKAFLLCPEANVKLETIKEAGPVPYETYRVTMSSKDPNCGRGTFAMVSKKSGQIVLADVYVLPVDGRSAAERLGELGSRMLKKQATGIVDPKPLADGLKRASIAVSTKHGILNYGGFVDASERFFLVGTTGPLSADPGKILLDSIGAQHTAWITPKGRPIEIIEISDFQCPTCKRAHDRMEPFLKKYGSKVSYGRLDLPLFESHEWSFQAALAARAIQRVAPDKYKKYVDYIFSNQESIKGQTVEQLIRGWMEDNDVDWKKIAPLYNSPINRRDLMAQVGHMYDNGIFSTPTFLVNGQQIYYGPDGEHLWRYLEALAGGKKK